ncbi:pilus assembly PilX family protein [Silvimonas iriomotensis]|uniref:Tfp pilus assembly protein PilX n=1 Tax=Silvimonas iriomotensis TaxID=449662 RepID=A0ABQ2PBR4_9NEIS|nr:hypothetical protein [Silvimonas iriomotensis]GGP22907.1 hypothetical protein GCM10010970_29070 [Silvimonas iriomotensis]
MIRLPKQTGASLLLGLIVLVVLLIATVALMRSSDTANLIAGNVAFKQAATQLAELGVNDAKGVLGSMTTPDTNVAPSSSTSYAYYALQQTTDSAGLPSVTWSNMSTVTNGLYQYQYVIERMCTGTTPVSDFVTYCSVSQQSQAGLPVNNNSNAANYQVSTAVFYRVTVHVTGPHSSESFIQAMFLK